MWDPGIRLGPTPSRKTNNMLEFIAIMLLFAAWGVWTQDPVDHMQAIIVGALLAICMVAIAYRESKS